LNDKKCAYRAVEELLAHGHQNIGCILKLDDGQGHARYSGYLEAMKMQDFRSRMTGLSGLIQKILHIWKKIVKKSAED